MAQGEKEIKQDIENITIGAPAGFKEDLKVKAVLRGFNLSTAGYEILQIGLPLWLKKHPIKHKLSDAA